MRYNLVVLGGGPAGYTGALRAAKLGMSVALVEADKVGGTCLNRGCIPTKCLLKSSSLYASRSEWSEFGVRTEGAVSLDEDAVYARKDAVVTALRDGILALVKAGKIVLYPFKGRLVSAHEVEAGGEIVEGDNVLIATGSRPAVPNVKGAQYALTSDDVLEAPVSGDRIAVIGGGVIGSEFACYFNDTGKSVTVLEYADKILPALGKEISQQMTAAFRRKGIAVHTSARVTEIGKGFVKFTVGDEERTLECDAVISATGRRAVTEDIGLENVGLPVGAPVAVDGNMMTSVAGVYAAGDVTGGIQLAHYAAACAVKAVHAMAGRTDAPDLSVVPSLIYTEPEIAVVGNTTTAAKSGKFLLGANGKSLINGSNRGFIKVYCDDKDCVVGAELFGHGVTELMGELALAVKCGLSAQQVADTVHAHPTVYESVAEACEDVFGLAVHKR